MALEDILFWRIGPAAHVLSLAAVALLGVLAIRRYGTKGVLLPAFVVALGEAGFWVAMSARYGQFGINPVEVVVIPFALVVYGSLFAVPRSALAAYGLVLLWNVLDGFKVSYGFLPGSPYFFDPQVNFKEVMAWWMVSSAMVDDMRGKAFEAPAWSSLARWVRGVMVGWTFLRSLLSRCLPRGSP